MNFIRFLARKFHERLVFINVMVNSIVGWVHFKTKEQMMLYEKWYGKIVMWPFVRLRQLLVLVRPAYFQYCINFWLPKKFVRVGSYTTCRSFEQKGLCWLVEGNTQNLSGLFFIPTSLLSKAHIPLAYNAKELCGNVYRSFFILYTEYILVIVRYTYSQ